MSIALPAISLGAQWLSRVERAQTQERMAREDTATMLLEIGIKGAIEELCKESDLLCEMAEPLRAADPSDCDQRARAIAAVSASARAAIG